MIRTIQYSCPNGKYEDEKYDMLILHGFLEIYEKPQQNLNKCKTDGIIHSLIEDDDFHIHRNLFHMCDN